jgi:F0F1-type ATP synthase delta subunit
MQSKVRIYAKVLHESLKGVSLIEQKKRMHIFKEILKKRGDMKISHGILQEFQKLEREQTGRVAKAISAKHLSPSVKTALVSRLQSMKFTLEDHIDPRVIGGVALFLGKEFLIDNTILARLRKLSYGKKLSF